ncbi:MAG TPA: helix-turn-helix transcriptional regulator [Candidatus Limnocylindrales bacterium]|jgi:transcriptional regulator with XRE-family HTH domain
MRPEDEDERLAQLLRATRRRAGMTQADVARLAQVPRDDVMSVEAGRAREVGLGRLRRIFAAVDARLKVDAWWRGAAADRLLDERHAWVDERAVTLYGRRAWATAVEVTFSEWGERGSIDLLAGHAATRAVAVNEIKGSIGSLEELNRTLDVKVRLAPNLAEQRFGWRPASVSRVLIVPNDSTVRRLIDRHARTMAAVYPLRGREFRAWLRRPAGPIGAIWFVSEVADGDSISRQQPRLGAEVAVRGG